MKTPRRKMQRTQTPSLQALIHQYACGAVHFSGNANASYERHVMFDHVVEPQAASLRKRFEAVARSLRDLLVPRWLQTDATYEQANPKQVYYLSMEFLIGRSLTNNLTNLLVEPMAREVLQREGLDLVELAEQEPDAGLGNGGLGRLAACFLDSLATMQLPAMGYGLRYHYGIFRQQLQDGYQVETPDPWLRHPDPWEVPRLADTVQIPMHAAVRLVNGVEQLMANQPSVLLGFPFDRPVVGYGGKTINTLRLWEAGTPHEFDFGEFSSGDFLGAVHDKIVAEHLVAPQLTVVWFACNENGGPGILPLGTFPNATRRTQAWTPQQHSAPMWHAPPEDKPARVTLASTRARTSAFSAQRVRRRSAPRKARPSIACGPRRRR